MCTLSSSPGCAETVKVHGETGTRVSPVQDRESDWSQQMKLLHALRLCAVRVSMNYQWQEKSIVVQNRAFTGFWRHDNNSDCDCLIALDSYQTTQVDRTASEILIKPMQGIKRSHLQKCTQATHSRVKTHTVEHAQHVHHL